MAAQEGHETMVQLLLDRGAHMNHAMSSGSTPLFIASAYGHEAVVRLLLDRGADINQAGLFGGPLHCAAYKGYPSVIELLLRHGTDAKVKEPQQTALDVAKQANNLLCAAALQPRTIACLRPWTAKTAGAFPLPFRLSVAVLLRQVSHQTPPAIAPDPAREAPFNLGRTRGVPMCPVTDATTGETRDVDLLQELILNNGLIDADWFSIDPKKRLRTWLRPERRLALRQWEVGDTVLIQGLVSKPELNGRVVVVEAYLRKKRRFTCVLKDKKKDAGNKPLALRPVNLEAPRCAACRKCGAALRCSGCRAAFYCGASCQKAGWRGHKTACKAAKKAASGSGGAGVGSGRGGGQSGNRPHGGANDVGLGPASNGVVGSPFAHGELVNAAHVGDLKKVKWLLASGVDIEHVCRDFTALMAAAEKGHTAVVKFLLGKGADVHHDDSIGATALYMAAQEGQVAVVLLLLDQGANVNQARCVPG